VRSTNTPATFDQYLMQLSKRSRKRLRDLDRDYLRPGRSKLELDLSIEQADAMLRQVALLHQSRWADRDVSGCFSDPRFDSFTHHALGRLHPQGAMRVALMTMDDRPLAGAVLLRQGSVMSFYLVGMDVAQQEHLPGWQLNLALIQTAFQWGCRSVEFLRGDEPYKQRLGAQSTTQHRWLAAAPGMMPWLLHQAYEAGHHVRQWWSVPTFSSPEPA
jgi:CelD/BcsL family acetyltransferase involved in cellulose biosynthesis